MQTQIAAAPRHKIVLSLGVALLALASCAKPGPKTVAETAPPVLAVGHVYPVAVIVPPPVSSHIHFTAAQAVQTQQAFNVVGLKSALMVAALSCNQQPQYDAFMTAFHPHILAEQHVMDAYFHKASGRMSGQKMEDDFVIQLANSQSDTAIAQGSIFCLNSAAEFKAVMAQKTTSDMDSFVTDQPPATTSAMASATTAR